ncbi:hypothetical protein MUB42_02660 [Apilactobacillus kunkeei]|nr:hypothetical protein MUB42_02660 [Apilactobacillus kunkeei]
MLYNRNKIAKNNDKKILRKVKKNWIIVSFATFAIVGSTYMFNDSVSASASENNNSIQTASSATSNSNIR